MVTLVFTDIEGSTRLVKQLRDGYWEVLAAHRRLVREAFGQAQGREIDTQGDSFFFAFNKAKDAVAAAIAAQRALSAYPWPAGAQVRVRMGIHSTRPTLWSGGYLGLGVHRAARICSAAHGGQILMSAATRALVRSELPASTRLHNLGRYQLKDLDRPDRIWQVSDPGLRDRFPPPRAADRIPGGTVGPPDAAGIADGAAPGPGWLEQAAVPSFVGRATELRALEEAWSQAASGRRILVLLGGEPGIGKTTLAARLAVSAHASGALVLHGRWDDAARISYQAFIECFTEYSRGRPKTVLDAGLDRHAQQISRVVQAAGDRIGADDVERPGRAESEQSRVFEAVDGLLRAMASRRPVLLVLDDLQWADSPSLLLLERLMRIPGKTPLLVLATYRNTELGRAGGAPFLPPLTRTAGGRQMDVGGLSAEESAELVARVTGVKLAEPAPLWARELHRDTAGNPSRLIDVVQRRHEADTLPAVGRPRSPSDKRAG